MSRCFPYPPPGYSLSRASNEALIESIKLQNEREISKVSKEHEKKDKKRDKKEKRKLKKEKKEKKEKRKEKKDGTNQKLHDSDSARNLNGQKVTKGEFSLKKCEAETDQLERSSVSEEHEQPVSLPAPSSSSDSTENSNKRKRPISPSDCNRTRGNIIRIKLTSRKDGVSNAIKCERAEFHPAPKMENDCSAVKLGRMDVKENVHCAPEPTNICQRSILNTATGQICSTSRPVEAVSRGRTGIPPVPTPVINSMQKGEVNTASGQLCSTSRPVEAVNRGRTGIPPVPTPVVNSMHKGELNTASGQLCSTSRPVEAVNRGRNGVPPVSTPVITFTQKGGLNTATQQICSTSRPVEVVNRGRTETPSMPTAVMTKMQKQELKYKNLFENWSPPPLQAPCGDEDLDWLLQSRKPDRQWKSVTDSISCSNSNALRPQAQYIKEVDIYALPYTVPF